MIALSLAAVSAAAQAAGLAPRGALWLDEAERSGPLVAARTVLLLGAVGSDGWPAFAASAEAADGQRHPLDRWSRRVVTELAQRFGAMALFPFEGPPYFPFQAWGARAEPLYVSPLGMYIHPRYGLWHSYRGALAFAEALDLPPREQGASPCDSCVGRPCLAACPVGAFTAAGYDVAACADWLRSGDGGTCLAGGCLARRACPVGRDFTQRPQQAALHMAAFLAGR
ncbi:MAG TPA: ferredoxin [Roseiarcus sp.]|nr:ferredoxin [Roseiarcus sp.]